MRNFAPIDLGARFGGRPRRSASTPPAGRALESFAFDPNPGNLGAKAFVPAHLASGAALVVVLHGCTQTPEGYDHGTGWTSLAERHGFAVLYPEQARANNANGCFNWFEPGDMRRGAGEPASIKAMIDRMVADHGLDPARIYITGLSAGAAMAGVMLATYPEMFAGGGLIAGLPYGVASSMPAAFSRMRARGRESDAELAALVRGASDHAGPWPSISVWHGTADMTVDASNADATVAQWLGLEGTECAGDVQAGYPHRVWRDARTGACVEEYVVTGMGHGTPLDTGHADRFETAGAYLLDVGLSSTRHLAAAWGLTGEARPRAVPARDAAARPMAKSLPGASPQPAPLPTKDAAPVRHGVQKIIEDALRSAGLMR